MKGKIAGLAAVSALLVAPAHAEMGRGPGPGKAYISVEGGYQNSDGPAVAAHGDLGTISDVNPDTSAQAGVLSTPDGNLAALATQAGADGQVVLFSQSGAPATTAAVGTSGVNPSATAGLDVQNDVASFVNAVVDVFSSPDTEEAFADAQGGDKIKARDGSYAALTFGYGFVKPALGTFDRIEVYGSISRADESQRVDGAAGAVSVDGTSGFAAAVIFADGALPVIVDPVGGETVTFGPVTTNVKHSVDFAEFGGRLKADRWTYNAAQLSWGLEGFYAIYNQDTSMSAFVGGAVGDHIGNNFSRTADVDSSMTGVLVSFEGQLPISGTPFSLIGRTFGGLYVVNADGDFRDNFGLANVRDDLTEMGYRLGVEGGVRYDLSRRASISVTGSIDHFSDVATADLPQFAGQRAHVDTDDLTNYKVGARLTVTLGDDPEPFK